MKVGVIPSADLSYNSGSVIYAKNLFRFLRKSGDEAYLIGSKAPTDLPDELMNYVAIDERILEHPIIDDRPVENQAYGDSIAAIVHWLLGLHKNRGLDVIHAHYGSFTSYAAHLVHGLTKIPFVVSSFGRDVNIGCQWEPRIRWLMEQSLGSAHCVIAPDSEIIHRIAALFPELDTARKCVEIPMPLDPAIFEKGDLAAPSDLPIIASINSCFSPEKGIETTIRAFAEAVKEIDCRLVIAGDDDHPDKKHARALKKTIAQLGLTDRVWFPGYLSRRNVGELLRSAALLVDARTVDNFSSVLLEAVFIGAPIVSSNRAKVREAFQDGRHGFLFEPNDCQALAQKILALLKDKSLAERMRRQARRWGEETAGDLSEARCFERVRAVYRSAIAAAAGKASTPPLEGSRQPKSQA